MKKLNLEENIEINKKHHFFASFVLFFFIIIPIIFGSFYIFLVTPPEEYPVGKIIEIEKGQNLNDISKILKKNKIINSEKLFILGKYKFNNSNIKAGKYIFNKKLNIWDVYKKLINSQGVIFDDINFTIKEGEPNYLIAKKISKVMENIEEDDFLIAAKKYEGQLYPETYKLAKEWNSKMAVKRFVSEFNNKLKKYDIDFKSEDDKKKILTIASLIEAEAGSSSYENKRHVSGVIYNRLKKNMLLQIDSTFLYIKKIEPGHRRVIYKSDFKLNSKYNTYKYPGLPPGPINNPSIQSIKAALNPMKTDDLYYITGCDGKFYYARNGVQHNIYVKKYLRDKKYCGQF